jgi:Putative AphA-like transcriptional regulator
MFRDHSLVPAEAIRLAALGLLAEAPRPYADLTAEVRYLTSRIAGPSPELMGTSLELLRYEGLVAQIEACIAWLKARGRGNNLQREALPCRS